MNSYLKSDIEHLLKNAFNTTKTVNGSDISVVVEAINLMVMNEILCCAKGTTKKQMLDYLTTTST